MFDAVNKEEENLKKKKTKKLISNEMHFPINKTRLINEWRGVIKGFINELCKWKIMKIVTS